MEKYIYNEKNGLWYELQGDYYLPCLKLPEEEAVYIGIWGQRHRRYLKEHRRATYAMLLTSGKLNSYLADVDRQAEELFSQLVKQMAEAEGITEALKAADQMEWVRRFCSYNKSRAQKNSWPWPGWHQAYIEKALPTRLIVSARHLPAESDS